MGRLTWKKPDGTWGLANGDIKAVPREYYGHMCKLKDYEETGLEPGRIEEVNELYLEKCKEVNELQEKITQYQNRMDNLLERLTSLSFERQDNEGMGGQLIVALDDVVDVLEESAE